jgi:hypothetical protein
MLHNLQQQRVHIITNDTQMVQIIATDKTIEAKKIITITQFWSLCQLAVKDHSQGSPFMA